MESLQANARDLDAELDWLRRVLDARFKLYFGDPCDYGEVTQITPPLLDPQRSAYAELVTRYTLDFSERLALILALAPHLRPQLLDVFFTRNQTFDRRFSEFGGALRPDGSLLPTAETLAFVLGGVDLACRFRVRRLLDAGHCFSREQLVVPSPDYPTQPMMQAPLLVPEHTVALLTSGDAPRPAFGAQFPAQLIETSASWDDLVLHPRTRARIDEIATWLEHGPTLLRDWGMSSKLRPGMRCLFHGPPGTGKTLTASLLGRSTGREVYRLDLSLVVSKYIGETEKNLARVFDQAQSKGWMLFFDEADALFGKRVESRDAHDRYANQEVAFLLQRIECFDGVAILASNLKDNIDEAFLRRFEVTAYFPIPGPKERLQLWRQGFSAKARLDDDLDLHAVAEEHALSGGAVMNVIRFASLRAISDGHRAVSTNDVLAGIRRELAKEGKAA